MNKEKAERKHIDRTSHQNRMHEESTNSNQRPTRGPSYFPKKIPS